ncbi:MAG TPA: hypothetical protein VJN71_06805 [Nitrososphaerales archaeon]|nr:hypothetical protein [Nitrososphaerales archaeon]
MHTRYAIFFSLVVAILIISIAVYFSYFYPSRNTLPTSTYSFVNIPVGDVIIPKLAKNFGGGVSNVPLNATAGVTTNLTVSLYLQINANVTPSFQVVTPSGDSSYFKANFAPGRLLVIENTNASTVLTLRVSSSTPSGLYSAVVSFVDDNNSAYYWGTSVSINVAG